jgi:hypothetical protein
VFAKTSLEANAAAALWALADWSWHLLLFNICSASS